MSDRDAAGGPVTARRLVHDPDGHNTGVWPMPAEFVTPVDAFYTRSHAATPALDPGAWRLAVDGLVERPGSFTLAELNDLLPRREVTATLVCAGLRRNEFLAIGPLPGELPWGPEPIGTGIWSGFGLADLLRHVGVTAGAAHVEFLGLDAVERMGQRFGFGGSIELEKARSGDVLLATHMNGAPLPPAHGHPLRAVVPGWIGARSVKWLGRVRVAAEPSANYFQTRAYRMLADTNPREPRDISAGVALTEVPLNAVILEPVSDQVVTAGAVRVRGWATGPGMRPLAAVDVSVTGGRRWVPARITAEARGWTWVLWEAVVELPAGDQVLTVRATAGDGSTQPPVVGDTWNVKGYNNNAWHRVAVRAV